jgi:hypothetical protein
LKRAGEERLLDEAISGWISAMNGFIAISALLKH